MAGPKYSVNVDKLAFKTWPTLMLVECIIGLPVTLVTGSKLPYHILLVLGVIWMLLFVMAFGLRSVSSHKG